MARIRTIKPEFFTSEDIVALSPLARLLYIACWCEADRSGRFEWKPGTLKLRYFPGDACDIDTLATELLDRQLVRVYEADGRFFAEIPSFTRHQIINNRESASTIPPRVDDASTSGRQHGKSPSEATRDDASSTREARVKAEGRKERNSARVASCDDATPDESANPGATPVAALPLVDGNVHTVSQAAIDGWREAYPAIDVAQQIRSMRAWLEANPRNRKTAAGIERFIVGWLAKAQDRAPRNGAASALLGEFAGAK